MFQNFGGTVSLGSNGTGTRVSANSSTQKFPSRRSTWALAPRREPWHGTYQHVHHGRVGWRKRREFRNLDHQREYMLIVGRTTVHKRFTGRFFQAAAASTVSTTVNKVGVGSWTSSLHFRLLQQCFAPECQRWNARRQLSAISRPQRICLRAASTLSFGGGTFNRCWQRIPEPRRRLSELSTRQ